MAVGALALAVLACASSLGACTSKTASGSPAPAGADCAAGATPTVGDLPDAVNAVLVDKCQSCHTSPPKNHAPWALLSFEETQLRFGITDKRRWQRMAEVIEPGGLPHMPFGDAPPLTDAQLATLRSWFAGCAMPIPEGTGHDVLDQGGPEH